METAAEKKEFYSIKSNLASNLAIKDVDTNSRIVTGFYNAYNFFDDANDVLIMGCAKKSIKERGPLSSATAKIKHAMDHDLTRLPGKIITLEEKELDGITGIYFETKMADTQLGNDVLINYQSGVYDNHSIGFRYIDMELIERVNEKKWNKIVDQLVNPKATEGKSYLYLIKEIQMFEGSTVAFGCNSLTPFLGTKSNNPEIYKLNVFNRIAAFEKCLSSGSQSDEMMESIQAQSLQLKQIFSDLMAKLPEVEKPKPETTKGLNMDALLNSFSLSK